MVKLVGKEVGDIGYGLMGAYLHTARLEVLVLMGARPDMASRPAVAGGLVRGYANCPVPWRHSMERW